MPVNVLIIDDEEALRKLLSRIISLEGFIVEEAGTLEAGYKLLGRKSFDILLCDVKLPDGNGVEFVKKVKKDFALVEVILLTAYGNITDGVQAIKNGAFDYITKGNDNDRIIPLLHQAGARVSLQKTAAVKVNDKGSYHFEDIIGKSEAIKEAIRLGKRIAATDAGVLLTGETGTGKEVFANAIHAAGKRSSQPFIAINCSAFNRELLEGELFGHKAGAFTGAVKDKKGLVEMANNGTLFLDEIGEMNIELQAKLLRVLEDGSFIKLGDEKATRVNLRIIAATNRDLEKQIAEGQFREDLYYRLNGFTIYLPPLRERPEDIPLLAEQFLQRYAAKEGLQVKSIHSGAVQILQKQPWKGNIRELKNILQRAAILCDGTEIQTAQLPYEMQRENQSHTPEFMLAEVEKEHIRKVLLYTKGNKTRTAEYLGIGISTLYRKIEEYGL